MGSWNNHYGWRRCPLLDHIHYHAQIHHEEPPDKRYLYDFPAMHESFAKLTNWSQTGDFGYEIFGKSKIAYEWTGFMLLANNILLIGFHVLTGAKILNTLSDHSQCTVVFSVIATLMGIVMSLPRTLNHVSSMSIFSGKHGDTLPRVS
jgi:hypothetical protein